jgi:hypothetical protein
MLSRITPRFRLMIAGALALTISLALAAAFLTAPRAASAQPLRTPFCARSPVLCTETLEPWNYAGQYTGHDEPSVVFYSNTPGSGNSNLYKLTLPFDPPTLPTQDGTGGTFHFQLHPAFWLGMALCDDQSGPNPGGSPLAGPQIPCTPDSDANIFDGGGAVNPHNGKVVLDPDYIGKHPGTAFLELQFYPPSWVQWPPGISCDPTKWCVAIAIFQLNTNQNTGINNNAACLNTVGIEPANFAFITKNGTPIGPPSPLGATQGTFDPSPSKVLMMAAGDAMTIDLHDTANGLHIGINDLTSGQSGSMTASAANGFAAVDYAPTATTCTQQPHDFHPAYSTSSEHTRVPWAAHSYNVAFSDEIGHFEYCNAVSAQGGACTQAGVNDPSLDADDVGCFAPPFGAPFQGTNVKIGGCIGTDVDFDGVSYQRTWPGTLSDPAADAAVHGTSFLFTSPKFNGTQNYSRVAFEADLPRIEIPSFSPNNNCNRTTGAGCVNPPNGASFYRLYSTNTSGGQCVWQEGGPFIPGTNNTFGGSSTTEYGPLSFITYPGPAGPITRTNDFRNVLGSNPCSA